MEWEGWSGVSIALVFVGYMGRHWYESVCTSEVLYIAALFSGIRGGRCFHAVRALWSPASCSSLNKVPSSDRHGCLQSELREVRGVPHRAYAGCLALTAYTCIPLEAFRYVAVFPSYNSLPKFIGAIPSISTSIRLRAGIFLRIMLL